MPTTAKLKTLCRIHDISGYSRKRKVDLLKIVSADYDEVVKAGIAKLETIVLGKT